MRSLPIAIAVVLAATTIAWAAAASASPPEDIGRREYEVFYHHTLRNRTDHELRDIRVYIPVPQSDEYQLVDRFAIERNVPVHISNRTGPFGTKIKRVAILSLAPGEEAEVGFSCVVRLGPAIHVDLDPVRAEAPDAERLPTDAHALFTRDHHIFGLQDPAVKDQATRLLRAHPNPVDRAVAIHRYIASTLRYQGGDGWDPAPQVLARGSGSCTEFSYVFSALCRATDLPTRLVGASICPNEPNDGAFQDHGHHRWVEVFLPGHGWVLFDATLDRARRPRSNFVGTHHARTLVLTRIGDKGTQLGLSYVGANSHTGETARRRRFTWTQGAEKRLRDAIDRRDAGDTEGAKRDLERLAADTPGSRAAGEAKRLLAEPTPPPAG